MSVLVFAPSPEGNFKKSAYEATTYGKKTAEMLGVDCVALVLGKAPQAASLGKFGASKVFHVEDESLNNFDAQVFSNVISAAATEIGATIVILSHNSYGKSLTGRIAARLKAGSVSGANALPETTSGFFVQKNVFSGKAIASYEIKTPVKVISVMGNSIPPEDSGQDAPVEKMNIPVPQARVRILEVKKVKGKVPLPEAERVVSAGRGMKGPENWEIIEELAEVLNATTACSRPVADVGWRPHHEHVGQTGVAIRPNLYVAIGISGAIQHLAGVNQSKVIVVINKDPEAPFFKAADYGVVGDLFDVVPALTKALKEFKSHS